MIGSKYRFRFILAVCICIPISAFAQEKTEPTETVAVDPTFQIPPLKEIFGKISPSKESYLTQSYPIIPAELQPVSPRYSWKELKLENLSEFKFKLSPVEASQMSITIERITEVSKSPNTKLAMEAQYLLGDVNLALAMSGDNSKYKTSYDSFLQAIKLYPNSQYALRASYHMGIALLNMKKYRECVNWAHRQEARWSDDAQWSGYFRSLAMEAYFMQGRYIRSEDYMWDLANRINIDSLSSHLALRYGDALFWQARYPEAKEWYRVMQVYLNLASTLTEWMSKLYYAETFFQLGEYEEAQKQYSGLLDTMPDVVPRELIAYRLLEIKIINGLDINEAIIQASEIANKLHKDHSLPVLAWATELEEYRLTVYDGTVEELNKIRERLINFRKQRLPKALHREARLVHAMLEWKTNNEDAALNLLWTISPMHRVESKVDLLSQTVSDMVVAMLDQMANKYEAADKKLDFLSIADKWRMSIHHSKYRAAIALTIAKAYVESGLTSAGARLYQRLLMDLSLSESMRSRLLVQLAHAYSLLEKQDLVGKVLKLITEVPTDRDERRAYRMVQTLHAVAEKNYDQCSLHLSELLKEGVRGDELFEYALQGAKCARKAGKFEEADRFLRMMGVDGEIPQFTTLTTSQIRQWTMDGLYEKITMLVDQGKFDEAFSIFNAIQAELPNAVPPVETVFTMVRAYRQIFRPDDAISLWKSYSEKEGSDKTSNFGNQYTDLLDLLARTELIPRASSSEAVQ